MSSERTAECRRGSPGDALLTCHLAMTDEARTEYERALELARTEPERRFLRQPVAEVSA
jgi:predicted RNA polymerase sigma factor